MVANRKPDDVVMEGFKTGGMGRLGPVDQSGPMR